MIRKYPVGIQNFEDLRKEGYCYVDKTELMYQLVQSGKYYFLSRPRRFGKSLLLSTIQAYFEGKKELFHGLAVGQLEQEWNTYPVLHLDLNARKYDSAEALSAILNQYLESWETIYGDEKKDRAPEERFAYLIEKVSRTSGQQVVVLIDLRQVSALCHADRCHQIQQGQCIQRSEQSDGYFLVLTLRFHLRNYGTGAAPLL